jgi:hypothetical protein
MASVAVLVREQLRLVADGAIEQSLEANEPQIANL